MNDLEKFLDQFYSKYAPDNIPTGDRRTRLLEKLSTDFEGYTTQMYQKYAPNNLPDSSRLARLKSKYAGDVVIPEQQEELDIWDQLGNNLQNYFTADLPSNLLKGYGSYISALLPDKPIEEQAQSLKELQSQIKENPSLYTQIKENLTNTSLVDAVMKAKTESDFSSLAETLKSGEEMFYEDAKKIEATANREGIIRNFSDIKDPGDVAAFLLNNLTTGLAQVGTAVATGTTSVIGETIGDVYGESVERALTQEPTKPIKEILNDPTVLGTTGAVGAVVAALEYTGLSKILGKSKSSNIAKALVNRIKKAALAEGGTEFLQELSQGLGIEFGVGEGQDGVVKLLNDPKFWDRVATATIAGTLTGSVVGGGTGVTAKPDQETVETKAGEEVKLDEGTTEVLQETDESIKKTSTGDQEIDNAIDDSVLPLIEVIKQKRAEAEQVVKQIQEDEQKAEKAVGEKSKETKQKAVVKPKPKPKTKQPSPTKERKSKATGTKPISRQPVVEEKQTKEEVIPKYTVEETKQEKKEPIPTGRVNKPRTLAEAKQRKQKAKEEAKLREKGQEIDLETGEVRPVKMGRPKLSKEEKQARAVKQEEAKKEIKQTRLKNQLGNIEKRGSLTERKSRYESFVKRYAKDFPELAETASKRLEKISKIETVSKEESVVKAKREASKKTVEDIKQERKQKFAEAGKARAKKNIELSKDKHLVEIAKAERQGKSIKKALNEYNKFRKEQGLPEITDTKKLRLDREYIQEKVTKDLERKKAKQKLKKVSPSDVNIEELPQEEIDRISEELGNLDDLSDPTIFESKKEATETTQSEDEFKAFLFKKSKEGKLATVDSDKVSNTLGKQKGAIDKATSNLISLVTNMRKAAGLPKIMFHMVDTIDGGNTSGQFVRSDNYAAVVLAKDALDPKGTLIHEYVHPYTSLAAAAALNSNSKSGPISTFITESTAIFNHTKKIVQEAIDNINKGIIVSPLEKAVKNYIGNSKITSASQIYGLTNTSEMYSEAFGNTAFTEILLNIKDPQAAQTSNKTVLGRLAEAITTLINNVKGTTLKLEGTIFNKLVQNVSKLEEGYRNGDIDLQGAGNIEKGQISGVETQFKRNKSGKLNSSVVKAIAESIETDPNISTKKELVDYINNLNKQLSEKDRISKDELNEIWNSFKEVRGKSAAFSRLSTAINKTNPKKYVTKKGKTTVGKIIDPDTKDQLAVIHNALLNQDELSSLEETNKILLGAERENREPTDSELDRIQILKYKRFNSLLPAMQANLLGEINHLIKEGRTKRQIEVATKKARRSKERAEVLRVLLGKENQLSEDEYKKLQAELRNYKAKQKDKNFLQRFRASVNDFFLQQDSWDTLLDMLSVKDKDSDTFESPLNKMFGDAVAKAIQEENKGKRSVINKIQNKLIEIYGSKKKANKAIFDNLVKKDFSYIDSNGIVNNLSLTQDQAIKKWMEFQDASLHPTFEAQGLNGTFIKELEEFITPENKEFAEFQLDLYDEYYEGVNEVFRNYYGTDLPRIKKYSPINREGQDTGTDNMLEFQHPAASILNNSFKARQKNTTDLKFDGSMKTLMGYVAKMEHFKAHAELIGDMRSVFSDKTIRNTIKAYHGEQIPAIIDRYIQNFTRGGIYQELYNNVLDRIRVKFTLGSLGLNPTILIKQLTSFPAYLSEISISEFMGGLADFASNPRKARRVLMNTDLMQIRMEQGHDRDVTAAYFQDAANQLKGSKSFSNAMMTLVRLGDSGAIILGGWTIYNATYKKAIKAGKSKEVAHKEAVSRFEKVTRMTQQSSYINDLSLFQQGGSLAKLFTMFLTTPMQYFRITAAAYRNIKHGRNIGKSMKQIAIYNFVLPTLFQLASQGFELGFKAGEDDEENRRLGGLFLARVALGSLNGIFLFGPAIQNLANRLMGEQFAYHSTPIGSLVDDMFSLMDEVIKLIDSDELTTEDVLDTTKELSGFAARTTGVPVTSLYRMYEGARDISEGKTSNPLRLLGYSAYSIPSERIKAEDKNGKEIVTGRGRMRTRSNRSLRTRNTRRRR